MADDLSKRGGGDRSRVNVNEPHEVRYWTQKFGCTEDELRAAVSRVGVLASDVEEELGRPSSNAPANL
jgi:hypothetical protein